MAQLGLTSRRFIGEVKNFSKTKQIKKFDERQNSAKWTQLLAARIISG